MDKKKILLNKTLIICIILLFIDLTITHSIGISNSNDDIIPPVTTISFDPAEPDGLGGWYVSDVNVTLNATDDLSGVKEIHYRVAKGEWKVHFGYYLVFVLDHDCLIDGLIEFYAVDFAENQEEIKSFCCINIDQVPPDIEIELEVSRNLWMVIFGGYEITITAIVEDSCSGFCGGRVEFLFNGLLQHIVTGPGPTYSWTFIYYPIRNVPFKVTALACDIAGNLGFAEINGSEINSASRINFINEYSNNILPLWIFYRFPLLEVIISRIRNLRS